MEVTGRTRTMKRSSLSSICIVAGVVFLAGQAQAEYQPAMRKGLDMLQAAKAEKVGEGKIKNLQSALAEMDKADHDKGGYRVKAKTSIDKALAAIKEKKMKEANGFIHEAIEQVKAGIKFDSEHESKADRKREKKGK
jgi:hypothetical protein